MIYIRRSSHVPPKDHTGSYSTGIAGLWNKTSPIDSQRISVTKTDNKSEFVVIERWVECSCSDGPCELGLMTKYTITLDADDFSDIETVLKK